MSATNNAVLEAYKNAPKKIKIGRHVMIVGCVLFFIACLVNVLSFSLYYVSDSASVSVDLTNPVDGFNHYSSIVFAFFFLLAAIGGISFVRDKGPLKKVAPLASIILAVVFLLDTIIGTRTLIKNLLGGVDPANAWGHFFMDLLDVQLSGGIYLIGWFLIKDFVGD